VGVANNLIKKRNKAKKNTKNNEPGEKGENRQRLSAIKNLIFN